jgi:hypothetical protein
MLRILRRLLQEIIDIIPAVVFFCIAFNLIVLTDMLTTERYGIRVFGFVSATVMAIVVGKVMLAVNLLPWVNAFRNRPLIYNTLWRATLYNLASLALRYTELLVRFALKHGNLSEGYQHLITDFDWSRFWAVQIWLATLFLIFAALQEINRALGSGRLFDIFFGRK